MRGGWGVGEGQRRTSNLAFFCVGGEQRFTKSLAFCVDMMYISVCLKYII